MAKIGLSLSDYWLIIRKRRWVAVFCFLAIFLSVIINVQMQPPVYKAVCSVRMIERKSVSDMITQMVSYTSFDLMSSLTKVLCGRPVIEKVVYELGLADKNTPPEQLENIILKIQNSVKTDKEPDTNIVSIIVEYGNAQMAARIANTIAGVYVKLDMDEKNERAHTLRVFLEEQTIICKQRLSEAEEQLKSFREKGEATGTALVIENEIATLERQKTELKKIFTEKYPDILKINEQIENLRKQLQVLPESELQYARLIRDVEVNERSYAFLQAKFDEARIAEAERAEDVKIVNPAMIPKDPIRPKKQLAATMGLVVGLIIGIFASFVVETLDTSIGTIDDLEAILKLPVLAVIPYMKSSTKERKKRGRLFWRLLRFGRTGRSSSEDVENMKDQILIKYTQKSGTTEAYRILRTNIKVEESLKNGQHILLVTSTIPREGKSVTAVNLSLALAQDGYRVLLIDCDLRKAVLHKVFNVDKEPGLTDLLLGTSIPEKAIRTFIEITISDMEIKDLLKVPGIDNFNLLPCGKIIANPAELLDSPKINELFSSLKTKYDFLIIDSPPILPVPDTVILGKKSIDKIYLVYRASYTSKLAILRAKKQLDMVGITPSGVILNSTTPESEMISDYYHHYYHYRYYSEKDEDKKQK